MDMRRRGSAAEYKKFTVNTYDKKLFDLLFSIDMIIVFASVHIALPKNG